MLLASEDIKQKERTNERQTGSDIRSCVKVEVDVQFRSCVRVEVAVLGCPS